MTKIAIVIPAAGASSRMGHSDKLLEQVDGEPLLKGVADHALAVSDRVLVALPDVDSARTALIDGLPYQQVRVPDASEGMSASLRRAAAALPADTDGLMILPADMPDLTEDDLRHLLSAFTDANSEFIVQATGADGTPGHPVVFPADLIALFQSLSGDEGARSILAANRTRIIRVPLPDTHAVTDLDTPDAWTLWRANNPDR